MVTECISVYIYALREPDTGLIRYIGKTTRPDARYRDHLNDKSVCHRTNWIKSLKNRGLEPEMVLIEEIRGEWPWQASERFWIKYARRHDWPLVNGTDGGDGVVGLCEESRNRIAKAWIGRRHTEESKEKIGLASRLRKHSLETRQRMSNAHTGRVITWGDKLSEKLRKLSSDQVQEIKARIQAGEQVVALAKAYGVHRTTISKIKGGKYYERCSN